MKIQKVKAYKEGAGKEGKYLLYDVLYSLISDIGFMEQNISNLFVFDFLSMKNPPYTLTHMSFFIFVCVKTWRYNTNQGKMLL